LFVKRVDTLAWAGTKSLLAGISSTSSKVIPSVVILFGFMELPPVFQNRLYV
jgi:hypothetical protein